MSEPILRATGITIGFPVTRGIIFQREVGRVQAVDGVDLELHEGETLAIVTDVVSLTPEDPKIIYLYLLMPAGDVCVRRSEDVEVVSDLPR